MYAVGSRVTMNFAHTERPKGTVIEGTTRQTEEPIDKWEDSQFHDPLEHICIAILLILKND